MVRTGAQRVVVREAWEEEVALVARVVDGDDEAWRELVGRAHPIVLEVCRRRRLRGGPHGADDTARDVALRALDRLRSNAFAPLRRFLDARARYPRLTLRSWLGVFTTHVYVDYLRALPEYARTREPNGRGLRRVVSELAPIDDHPTADDRARDARTAVDVRRVVDALMAPEFPGDQRRVLVLWLHGNHATEIAAAMRLPDADAARRLLHAARQRLRRAMTGRSNR